MIGVAVQDWAFLGRCITRDRKRKQWRQIDLATAARLTKRTISNYETGRPPASAPDIPTGYYQVGAALGWPADGPERALAGEDPSAGERDSAQAGPVETSASTLEAIDLYPAVVAFARACARQGADPRLRDAFEESAERLLGSIASDRPAAQAYGLAAYRPHAWAEGDPRTPADDAAAVEQAIQKHLRGNEDT